MQLAGQAARQLLVPHQHAEHGPVAVRHLSAEPAVRVGRLGLQARVLDCGDDVACRGRGGRGGGRGGGGGGVIVLLLDLVVAHLVREPPYQLLRVGALPSHPQLQGPETADPEPALETTHDGAEDEALVAELRDPSLALSFILLLLILLLAATILTTTTTTTTTVSMPRRHSEHPTQHIAMAAEILSAGVHDDVGAPAERVEEGRRRERRVDGEVGAGAAGLGGVGLEVAGLARGVQRRLDVDDVAGAELAVGAVEAHDPQPRQLRHHADHPVAPVVPVPDGDPPRVQVHQERVERRQPRAVRQGRPAQDRGQDRFQPERVGRRVARVYVRVVGVVGLFAL